MTKNPKISCYIRTLNEERKIKDVIDAAFQLVDEIVIIDCGSSDKTCEIAKAMGAKVFNQEWLGNGFQKRYGEEKCTNDWLLDLDADEILSKELANEIKLLFADGEPALNVYRLKLAIVPPFGKAWHADAESTRAKLYNRKFHTMPEHKRWDQLELPKSTPQKTLNGPIYHYAFSSMAHLMTKLNNVSTKGANDTKLKPKSYLILRIIFGLPIYFLRHYLLRQLWRCGIYGFAYAMVIAIGRWLRDVKMYEIYLQQKIEKK